jgi:hypothetical protein
MFYSTGPWPDRMIERLSLVSFIFSRKAGLVTYCVALYKSFQPLVKTARVELIVTHDG